MTEYRFQRVGRIVPGGPPAYIVHTPSDCIGTVERVARGTFQAWGLRHDDSVPVLLTEAMVVTAGVSPYGERDGAATFSSRKAAARALEAVGPL